MLLEVTVIDKQKLSDKEQQFSKTFFASRAVANNCIEFEILYTVILQPNGAGLK